MGCVGCIKNKVKGLGNTIYTLSGDGIKWFVDGVSGIKKCLDQDQRYTDEQIARNRKICASCPHATRVRNNKLTLYSVCEKCHCLLICKTQVDDCPIGNFKVDLTIEKNSV